MLPTRKSVLRSSRQLDHTKTYLLTIVKRHKLQWHGQVSRSSGLAKTKTRQIEEEVGRQHQEMDRPGVRQVPEGSGEQGKVEETGCKIICGAPVTLAVKG